MTSAIAEGGFPELTLGWRMKMSLAYAGMDTGEVADKLEYSRGAVSRWINDIGRPPKGLVLRAWAEVTGVNLEWLVTGIGGPAPRAADGTSSLSRKAERTGQGPFSGCDDEDFFPTPQHGDLIAAVA